MTNLEFYKQYSLFTYPGLYEAELRKLPDDVREIGLTVRQSLIHRTMLEGPDGRQNPDRRFGDMSLVPWWRQAEDDLLQTAAAMLAELHRRDDRGLVADRAVPDKLVLTCRYVAILMASILKAKGIPARVRAGNVPYFDMGTLGPVSTDHWVNQYWSEAEKRWVTIDVDGSLSLNEDFDPYDMPAGKFDFPADAWLGIRSGKLDPDHFYNAGGFRGLVVIAWGLFYDFHSLMNSEIIYFHHPQLAMLDNFKQLDESQLADIDMLAELMTDPDKNFDALRDIWENKPEYRLLKGSLL
ncbi:MAG TPA: transglutaminase-like domain-containing protein [Candidatus Saccharimonadales bacterium]|nr:transglutaminase-like domain-containing protein [Candidatus Saccharimonadales bacterium]